MDFIKKNDEFVKKQQPHGRHRSTGVPDPAEYDQVAYDNCPYAKKQEYSKDARNQNSGDKPAATIKKMLIEQFDAVVDILNKDLGIKFSLKLLKTMLRDYKRESGHLYIGATIENIPWVFAYMSNNQKLFGQMIEKDGFLHKVITEHFTDAYLVETSGREYIRVLAKQGKYVDINFFFTGHKIDVDNAGNIIEHLEFVLCDGHDIVFSRNIELDHAYSLINGNSKYKNEQLILLARSSL